MKFNLYFKRLSSHYDDYNLSVNTNKKLNEVSELDIGSICQKGRVLFRLTLKDKVGIVQKRVIGTNTRTGRKLRFTYIGGGEYSIFWNNNYLWGLANKNPAERNLICKLGLDKLCLDESKIITFQVHK
jgi:hypothetical protein